ncbi:phytoene desaturase family protein [Fictibacillus barbaricus]|uniref:Phytoene dehydrogenase-like protein n=1 Tax=Fictibacillus barbaricus TaxID=182136 RepID=A0ABU1TWA2_9BACL|nr:FAD-dependent oxidoreductase [Fictibacillus barbaricus]MDR7071494.1 phytoene dehydrogenase-like protein [Fictibacillus barbaricus]
MNKFDVAIVGGGISGLTASIYLAKAGLSVAVYEKGKEVGGRAQSVKKNGAMLNLGAHAIYKGGEAEKILKELGVTVYGGTPDTKGDAIWIGKLHALPSSLTSLFTTRLLSWSGKMELGKMIIRLQKLTPEKIPHISLRDWAESEITDPMVRHIFYALCRTATYGIDFERLLAGAVLKQLQLALNGVTYVDGGWQSMVVSLRDKALKAGVTIHTQKSVSAIEYENGSHHVQFNDGDQIEALFVIVTTGPNQANKVVKGAEHSSLHEWKEKSLPLYAACLDVVLKKLPMPSHNFAIGIDQHILFTNQSRAAKLTDDGSVVINVLKYLGFEKEVNVKAVEQELEQVMDLMQPGWREEVAARQFIPHITVVQNTATVHTSFLDPAVPEIPDLYMAGDGMGHGEMLVDAAFASAKRASDKIIQKSAFNKIRKEA